MAFGNYNYNPYVNPYANPYNQQMPTFQQNIPQQMPTMQTNTQNSGFVWVDGIEEANNFYVAPNNAVQLWDKNAPCIYKKSADSTGKPTMQIFDLVERKMETPSKTDFNGDLSGFIKRDEFTQLAERVGVLERLSAKESIKEGIVSE